MKSNSFKDSYSPFLSIIIPVYNSINTLGRCLNSIKDSDYSNFEVIIVNDASTDNSIDAAREYECKIIDLKENHGSNYARNRGANSAEGELLVFIDSDVILKENALTNIVRSMRNKKIGAIVGIYGWEYRNENFISQYKNLWIRYSYIKSPPQIDWIFGAISCVRKEIFTKLEGFDYKLIARDGNDDIELGKRFSNLGYNIYLNPKVEVFHLKKFTFSSLLKNEFYRSMGFANLASSLGETATSLSKGFVNVYPSFIIGSIYSMLFALSPLILLFMEYPWWIFVIGLLIFIIINIRFLNFFEQVRGFFAMIVVIPILFSDQLTCFVGSVLGSINGILKRLRTKNTK
jgi:glycosyltransferase involved in cell wall biosynthesis